MATDPRSPSPFQPPTLSCARRPLPFRAVLYPELYTWFVFLAALDLLLTWMILHADGREVNIVADWVIQRFNLPGVVLFKFIIVALVVTICEVVGRFSEPVGRKLARWAVVLTAFPVVVGAAYVLRLSAELRAG